MPRSFSIFPRIFPFIAVLSILTLSVPSFAQTGTQTKAQPPSEEFDAFRLEHLKFLKMNEATEQTVFQQDVASAMEAAIHAAPHEEDKEQTPNVQSQAAASKVMGFPVAIVSSRKDQPLFMVEKKQTIDFTIDRASLQVVLDQAKRPDLLLPASFEQAHVQLKIPQSLLEVYGQCQCGQTRIGNAAQAGEPEVDDAKDAQTNESNAQPQIRKAPPLSYDGCLVFFQMTVPEARISSSMRFPLVMQILAQLVGDKDQESADSASIDWTNTLVVPIPDRSAVTEPVNGTDATLILLEKNQGSLSPFFLIWIREAKIYALMAFGDPNNAKELVDSIQ
jgi:hypothetical protein